MSELCRRAAAVTAVLLLAVSACAGSQGSSDGSTVAPSSRDEVPVAAARPGGEALLLSGPKDANSLKYATSEGMVVVTSDADSCVWDAVDVTTHTVSTVDVGELGLEGDRGCQHPYGGAGNVFYTFVTSKESGLVSEDSVSAWELAAVDVVEGTVLWRVDVHNNDSYMDWAGADSDVVVVRDGNYNHVVLDAATGEPAGPAFTSGEVFMAGNATWLQRFSTGSGESTKRFDPRTGEIIWEHPARLSVVTSDRDNQAKWLWAIGDTQMYDPQTGSPVDATLPSEVDLPTTVTSTWVGAGTTLHPLDGTESVSWRPGSSATTVVASVDEKFWMLDTDTSTFYLLDPASGEAVEVPVASAAPLSLRERSVVGDALVVVIGGATDGGQLSLFIIYPPSS